ncbi:L10-interacting MYB domain-containing protein [Quillaja saponaria]|uniref:L10-interacting MYB domain-containing protein n=1 Tax=Quillaja saponaria TaxID=32244 RepID=A0AAD7QBS4_QUISA|nr:L10-interacting MYB domain-containing protein [Quillaja saponaria]
MGSQIPSGSDRTRTNWTTAMESYFIDLLLDQVHRGNRMGHTFNKQAWNEMLTMFNANFGSPYDVNVLKSRYTVMWTQFNDIKNILDQNGFYWDRTRQMVMASNNVWDTYMKAHPDAQSYRNKALRNFNDLCLIYAHTSADGRYSMSSHDVDFDDDIQGVTTVVGVPETNLAPVSREHSKTDWTLAMDRYFVKLMLDHLKKGNKIGSTFNRQAWKDMVSLFNRKFGSNYGKSFLKQHYKKLLNYYSDIKKLLEVKGFSWDEKQQMIVADRDIWDKHIKVHPDAHLYRKKHLLNYQDLGLIYGNTIINGHCDHLLQGNNFEEDILQFKTGEGRECHFLDDNECLRGYWSLQMDCYFTDLLLDQALRGNKIGFKFTTQAWIEMVTLFTAKFGSHYMKDALNNRYKYLRRQYNDIKVLLKQHGFYWDEKQEMVTARDDIWDSYIKVHPDALLYRNKLIPGYHKLCVIYDQETSDGRFSHSASSADLNNDFPDLLIGEDIQDHAIGESQRTDWTPSMDRYLIDLMLEEVHSGNKVEYAINNQAWIDMVMMFNERFAVQLDKDILRSCYTSLEMLYYDMKNILDQKGFSWDEKQQLIAAHDDVWKAYFKEHPDATSYRTRPKPNYNDLCLIYGNSDSNLGCKLAGQDIHCNGDGTEHKNCHRRNDWTPPMDRYFIDLMLEKVRNGSMIDHKFEKLAWGDMVAKFSAEFGCQHDKDVLKSRYILLRKRFIDMKTLLGQGGFAWDETRQMIIADDDLWDDYVKEHPDAWTYQNRTLPNFNDLFLIYGDANSSRNGNYFSHSRDTGDNDLEMNIGDEKYDQSPGSCGRRIPWTKEMDSYLIDLMLEQLQRVTELGCTFK